MTRPERRTSTLTGLSAIAPNQPSAAEPATPEKHVQATPSSRRTRVAYYTTVEDDGRIRSAYMAGRDRYGWRTFSDFQLRTILTRVEELEAELNGGEPFEPVPPKGAQLGRPLD